MLPQTKKTINPWFIVFPLLFPFMLIFSTNEWIVAGWVVILILGVFLVQYIKREWMLLGIGILGGIIAEVGGDMIVKLQYWGNGSLLGIPVWLPLLWGLGFIAIHRIGRMIITRE